MYVEENCASWCTSDYANDQRAITIEVASDTYAPYKVTDAAYAGLIKLVADICKRNGIKKLIWSTNKNDRVNHLKGCNMTVHRDYAQKSCPGDYLYNRHGDIAKKVNAKLNPKAKVGDTLVVKVDECGLYNHSYKDVIGKSSVIKHKLKKDAKVKLAKDLGNGWCKISYKDKYYYALNGNFKQSKLLSKHPTITLKKTRKCRLLKDKKLAKIPTILKKGTKVKEICKIKTGDYAGYSYIGIDKKRYYIKNLKFDKEVKI